MKLSVISVVDHHPDHGRPIPDFYRQLIAQAELAEELGCEAFFVAEHHFHPYGVVPNPAVILSAIAQRTSRIRIGPAISLLTFANPLKVAEDYAMLDVLSNGRLLYGVGSGYLGHEFAGFNQDVADKRDRFEETFGLVRRLLAGERVTHRGKYHRLDDVAINVRPIQDPLPYYVAILRPEGAVAVGAQGHGLFTVPYASLDRFEQIGGLVGEFRRGAREAGAKPLPGGSSDSIVALHTHVAETDDEARRVAERPFNLYVKTRLYGVRFLYDDILRNGLGLFGSVETVAEKLVELERMGIDHVMMLSNFGQMAPREVERSLRMMMEEALPRARSLMSAKPADAAKSAA